MTDPIALVPLPKSVRWSSGTWTTDDPWAELSIGVSEDLPVTEYSLSINPTGAALTAGSEAAIADGRNTFEQILAAVPGPRREIPCVVITDRPDYAWRGMHLDVARHFFPIQDIRSMIDAMALHRLNVLHLHLTDDQGWRVEIKGYPRLTEVGSVRKRTLKGRMESNEIDPSWEYDETEHGGFYTQDELRELDEYARKRGVSIVPEVDLPGHMQAAVAAYPSLGNFPNHEVGVREVWGISDHVLGVSDEAFSFVRDVLEQVSDLFQGPYFHIGGDECPTTEWERSTAAREKMNEWGYTRVSEIQGHFTDFAAEVLAKKGKRIIGWDEILHSHLPDDTVVMNWRGDEGVVEATRRGFQTIIATCSVAYFDWAQSKSPDEPFAIGSGVTTLKDVYTGTFVPSSLDEEQKKLVLGLQGQLWTEYIDSLEHLQYMAFPRLCALAERAWGSPGQSFKDFEERLGRHLETLRRAGIGFRPLD